MYLTESEIALDTQAMADNLMACIKSLAEVDSTKDADLQALNLETAWKTSVLSNPIHTPYLARWLASKVDMETTLDDLHGDDTWRSTCIKGAPLPGSLT